MHRFLKQKRVLLVQRLYIEKKLRFYGIWSPRTLRWFGLETLRRLRLRKSVGGGYCKTVLVSYPRSGNHLARALIEWSFQRPTLGDGDDEYHLLPQWMVDRPLFLRTPEARSWGVNTFDPVLIKRHQLNDSSAFKNLILLLRDPVDCILSHTQSLSESEFALICEKEVQCWLNLLRIFKDWDSDKRLLVRYDELVRGDSKTFSEIVYFLTKFPDLPISRAENFKLESAIETLMRTPTTNVDLGDYWVMRFPERAKLLIERIKREEWIFEVGLWGVSERYQGA